VASEAVKALAASEAVMALAASGIKKGANMNRP